MFEVINQAWLLTITSPTTACSPTVKAREIHSATPAACTVRHILLLLHFLTERVTGCQMKCSFDSAACSVYQPGLISHRRDYQKDASFVFRTQMASAIATINRTAS